MYFIIFKTVNTPREFSKRKVIKTKHNIKNIMKQIYLSIVNEKCESVLTRKRSEDK